jgi:putative phosphoesterase
VKIVVFGDIHANLPAFEAVLKAAHDERPARVVHTGDLVGFGPFPAETVRAVAKLGIEGVRGNLDEATAFDLDQPYPMMPGDTAVAERLAILRWTQGAVDFPSRARLRDLPFEHRFEVGGRRVVLFHANPTDLVTPVSEDLPDHVLKEIARGSAADIVILGHTHRPFHKIVDGVHIVNAGSVGLPLDGDPRSHLLVLDLSGIVRVEIRRVAYDVERTIGSMHKAGLPAASADWFRHGRLAA